MSVENLYKIILSVNFSKSKRITFLLVILASVFVQAQAQHSEPPKDIKSSKYVGVGSGPTPAGTLSAPLHNTLPQNTGDAGLGMVGGADYSFSTGGAELGVGAGMRPRSAAEASEFAQQLTAIKSAAASFAIPSDQGPIVPPNPDACTNVNIAQVLSGLTYSGHSFNPTGASCIVARTDREAADRRPSARFMNPASPEYLGVRIQGGRVDYNPDGYFIVLSAEHNRTKQEMCLNPILPQIEGLANSQTRLRNMISPRWQWYNRQDGTRDGLCICQFGRSASDFDGSAGVCTSNYFTNVVEISAETLGALGVFNPGPSMAATPPPAETNTVSPTGAVQQVQPTPQPLSASDRIVSCITDAYSAARSCGTLSSQATTRCRQVEEQNSPFNTTGQILGAGAQVNTVMRAGTGNQGNCMRASALAMTARATMESFGESCASEVTACRSQCKTNSYEEFIDRCVVNNNTSVASLNDTSNTSAEAVAFREKSGLIADNYSRASRVCNVELPQVQSDTTKIVNGLGDSMQSSMACACQTSSAAGANCQAIPNINNCATNPNTLGCEVYGALSSCVPGSPSYNAKTCNCLQNPSTPGCNDSSVPTAASMFGGSGLKTAPAAGGSVVGASGVAATDGARASNIDLTSGTGGEAVQADLNSEAAGLSADGKPAVGNVGNYVGSDGGAGNGNIQGDSAAANVDGQGTVFGGLFNQVKNAVLNAVGKGGARGFNKAVQADASGGKVDMKKFRPIRGLANTDDIVGSRNMDIWIMMNRCMRGESCKSNMDGFIVDP